VSTATPTAGPTFTTTPTASTRPPNYLTKSGVSQGAGGVRKAIFAYSHADWYVNDVLYYASRYGGGTVLGDPNDCGPVNGDPDLPPLTGDRVAKVLAWAKSHHGDSYQMAAGPNTWDCSGFTQAGYRRIGLTMPRTASAQRSWLAAGNGTRIRPGQEKPGDLILWDSYLGPNQIGHVMIIWNPATKTTIEAHNTRTGVGHFTYSNGPHHHIFESGGSETLPMSTRSSDISSDGSCGAGLRVAAITEASGCHCCVSRT
jgi:cell wall-associated NlpC family hydrolase